MEKWWFNSMMFNRGLEYRCGLSKSIDSFGPIENNSVNEDPSILTDMDNTIHSDFLVDVGLFPIENNSVNEDPSILTDMDNTIHSDFLVDFRVEKTTLRLLVIGMNISDKTFLVRDSNSNSYSIHNWNNIINGCIEGYLRSEICIDSSILDDSDINSDNDWDCDNDCDYDKLQKASYILEPENDSDNDSSILDDSDNDSYSDKVKNSSEIDSTSIITITNHTNDFSHLWVACDNCYGNNYKRFFKSKMNICEYCGCHLKMSSSDRIELLIDPGTWNPMDEDMVPVDPIEFNSEDEPSENDSYENDSYENSSEDQPSENDSYENDSSENSSEDQPSENDSSEKSSEDQPSEKSLDSSENSSEDEPSENDDYQNRLDSYQNRTGLLDAVQTGTGQLNGIPVAIGIMDFQFMGGSMGSVVGEKITRLIEYATNQLLPLIIVCASGGARMQEGSLSLMQMGKISSALYDYQINQKLFYVTILTSPTTGGVTASFGMLGDIIIAEPDAYIAFAGKRVIEQTLNVEVPEGSQSAEFLFEKGLFDSIVPRNSLKEVLSELFHFHGFFPLTQTEK
uniref:Acetyl-coenzyme A carboxylase carboxyl transferase subunit beta n=1 Tax=Medicago orbicularis TaxID=70962 RepID=A0A4P8F3G6_9FABA|nr:acetyl-CoA carboxylase beta subunit [Medicago orbicularis]QCO73880.1 acetyl-CoA carboxylase beta subunit [Medicago orbicularis]